VTLVDTSAWVEALRHDGRDDVRDVVAQLLTAGQAAICPMVALELWNGAGGEAERAKIRRLVGELPSLPITDDAWILAHALARAARVRGLTVPSTDLLISATARAHAVGLVHADRHFELLGDVEPRE